MSLQDKRVAVSGATGVIGQELLKRLAHLELDVLAFDRNPLSCATWDNIHFVQKDLANESPDELREFRPHVVFHLAGSFERTKETSDFWDTNWTDNLALSHRFISAVKKVPSLETFIFASSYLVYSPFLYLTNSLPDNTVCLKEDDPLSPRNLCGVAKYYIERELEFVGQAFNSSLRTVCARIFRVYGQGSRDIISRWIRASLSGQSIQTYNTENRFDFVFAGDVAEGLMRLAQSKTARGPVNIGSGHSRSITDVLDFLLQHGLVTPARINDLGRKEALESSCADTTRLRRSTGWVPPTSLEEGMRIVLEFERRNWIGESKHG